MKQSLPHWAMRQSNLGEFSFSSGFGSGTNLIPTGGSAPSLSSGLSLTAGGGGGFSGVISSITPLFSADNISKIVGAGSQAYQAIQAVRAQTKVTNYNLERLRNGQSVIDPSTVAAVIPAPRVQVDVGAETRNEITSSLIKPALLGAGVLGLLFVLNRAPATPKK